MRTIYILWLRQIKRHFRSRSRMLGSLAQPVLFLVSLGYGFGSVFQRAGEGSYIGFLAPGIIAMSIIFPAIFTGIDLVWDRQFGFLKETLVAPVPRLHIMLGRTLGGATIATFQGIIVFVISMIAGFRPENIIQLIAALGIMFLIATLFTAAGTAIASQIEDMQGFQVIMNFIVMPLFFLSGALFPVSDLPSALSTIVRFNPLSYGVDALRAFLTGAAHFGVALDLAVLSGVTACFLLLGAYLFSKVEI